MHLGNHLNHFKLFSYSLTFEVVKRILFWQLANNLNYKPTFS